MIIPNLNLGHRTFCVKVQKNSAESAKFTNLGLAGKLELLVLNL